MSTSVPKIISLDPLVGVMEDIVFVEFDIKDDEVAAGGFHCGSHLMGGL